MSMIYKRTYKVIYSDTVLPLNTTLSNAGEGRGQMAKILEDNGINILPSYSNGSPSLGQNERRAKDVKITKLVKITPSGQHRVKYETQDDGYEALRLERLLREMINDGVFGKYDYIVTQDDFSTIEQVWRNHNGNTLRLTDLSFLGDLENAQVCDELSLYPTEIEEHISIKCHLENSSTGWGKPKARYNILAFTITWEPKDVQRKDAIEKWLVQYPLSIIAHIQAKYEQILMESNMDEEKYTSAFFEDVTIDCHFDAISESRSECTPDIIKQVRDAKNAKKMEMMD